MGVEVLYYVLNSECPLSEVPLCMCTLYMYMYSILSVGSLVVPVWSMYVPTCTYLSIALLRSPACQCLRVMVAQW